MLLVDRNEAAKPVHPLRILQVIQLVALDHNAMQAAKPVHPLRILQEQANAALHSGQGIAAKPVHPLRILQESVRVYHVQRNAGLQSPSIR